MEELSGRFGWPNKGKEKKQSIVLEAIWDGELWIWYACFGSPGSRNDPNVLDHSFAMEKMLSGKFFPSIPYTVNGVTHNLMYYLSDGIYPLWAIFIMTITDGATRKEKVFCEATRTGEEGYGDGIHRASDSNTHIADSNATLFDTRHWPAS